MEGTRRFLHELNRFGITGVFDPGGHNLAPEEYDALFRLSHANSSPCASPTASARRDPAAELADCRRSRAFCRWASATACCASMASASA